MKTTYQVPGTEIIHEVLDNEVIIANLDSGVYYSIRESGAPIWQLLLSGYNLSEATSMVAEKYSMKIEDISAPLQTFVNQLLDEELLVNGSSLETQIKLHLDLSWPTKFNKPSLEKYEEMKNLLMLDPIHEVDEQGWPHQS
ncbi:MAG: hypothetical protein K0R66_1141 [Gammaproteobacteria bacterium]|jgi:hypothetical protein|nr:hypothetical protein [Gammaproteobacteria bacterium]